MTESKLAPVDALVHQAIREEVADGFSAGEVITPENTMAGIQRVLGKSQKVASALIPASAIKAPKGGVQDARSAASLERAALSLVAANPDLPPEEAIPAAMTRAGLTKDMLVQAFEAPDWQATVARLCQQYLFVTNLPAIVSALVTKAKLADPAAAKLLLEMFGKSDLDRLDETTRALAEATPETRLRHTKAIVEELTRYITEQERKGTDERALSEARSSALAHLVERQPQR